MSEYFAAIRALDVDRWVNVFAPDAVSHDPVGTAALHGHADLRQFMERMAASLQSLSPTEDGVFVNGDSAAVKWKCCATSLRGRSIDFEGIDVIDCDPAGKIVLVRAFWNRAPLLAFAQS